MLARWGVPDWVRVAIETVTVARMVVDSLGALAPGRLLHAQARALAPRHPEPGAQEAERTRMCSLRAR